MELAVQDKDIEVVETGNSYEILETHFMDHLDKLVEESTQISSKSVALMKFPTYAKMGQDVIFQILVMAKRWKMDPIIALNGGISIVHGRPSMAAAIMNSRIRRAGHSVQKDPTSNNEKVTIHGKRADNGDTASVTFSMEDAKKAGLVKSGSAYEKFGAAMMWHRALSLLGVQLFPDVIFEPDDFGESLHQSDAKSFSNPIDVESSIDPMKMSASQIEVLKGYFDEMPDLLEKMLKSLNVQSIEEMPSGNYHSMVEWLEKALIKRKAAAAAEFKAASEGE